MKWIFAAALTLGLSAGLSHAETPVDSPFTPVAFAVPPGTDAAIAVLYQSCSRGRIQCFNHWLRQCQVRGTMAMWITSSRRC